MYSDCSGTPDARRREAKGNSTMPVGRITSIRADRGFGFIKDAPGPTGDNDIFFHHSDVTGVSFEELREGQDVSFDAGRDPKNPARFRASNVRLVDAATPEPDPSADDA
jgi:cold shock protein